jgi:hypothetical protein
MQDRTWHNNATRCTKLKPKKKKKETLRNQEEANPKSRILEQQES